MSEEFKREVRYVVTKIKTGKQVTCVVVEDDWPEYETVWRMIQDRMEGRPNELEQLRARNADLERQLAEAKERAVPVVPPTVEEAVKMEREACAKICDDKHDYMASRCADAIRARGKT